MSQDLRHERAGAKFETIAGATNYIAQLEAENARLRLLAKLGANVIDSHASMLEHLVMDTPEDQKITDNLVEHTRNAAKKLRTAFNV